MSDSPSLTQAERLGLSAAERFDQLMARLGEVADKLHADIAEGHALLRDLATVVKEAKDEVHRLSREEVRKHLAKEADTMAQRLREDIKRDKAKRS